MNDRFFDQTIGNFQKFKEVDAIVLGGSRASGRFDSASDYDAYVYLNGCLGVEKRERVLSETCDYMELNQTNWETEDDCVLKSGVPMEIIYRYTDDTCQNISNTLEKHVAAAGYTTCVCYNVFNSIILYDPQHVYKNLAKRFTMPYPEPLRKNIVSKNRQLLEGIMPSYYNQIEKAIGRGDAVSINHRLTEFIKSYFDILFALNRTFHPGEKRLIEFGIALCEWLPNDFETDMYNLFASNGNDQTLPILRKMILNLDVLIENHMEE